MSDEAVTTSEIEGEMLNRASVQSSIQRQLGLIVDSPQVGPKEQGISELMVDLYGTLNQPLSSEVLFKWHRMVMAGRNDVHEVGRYRTTKDLCRLSPAQSMLPRSTSKPLLPSGFLKS